MNEIKIYVVSPSENFEEFKKEFQLKNGADSYIAISVKDYENLSKNFAELRRYIDQKQIILYYEEWSNRQKVKQMEKKSKDPAYLMATFSSAAYREPDGASRVFEKYGYPNHRFIEKDGAQCYVVWNDAHAVVVFRGTEPTELSDMQIASDLNALQSKSFSGKGDVHAGFQGEINKLWDDLTFTLADLPHRQLKITGHSLGACDGKQYVHPDSERLQC